MIERVTFAETTFNKPPFKFEAGTPDIANTIAFGSALEYIATWDTQSLLDYELNLATSLKAALTTLDKVDIYVAEKPQLGAISFNIQGAHPHDVGTLLDQQGICVRTGHHCAMPLMDTLEIPGTVRASISIYNTQQDIDALIAGLNKAMRFL
jgi:selenocysteine lyase/cysteine desulfurase